MIPGRTLHRLAARLISPKSLDKGAVMKGLSEMSFGELEREIAAAKAHWDLPRGRRVLW